MYIPSFSLSKYLFWITTIVDVVNTIILLRFTGLNTNLIILCAIFVFAFKIPVFYVVQVSFDKMLIYASLVGVILSILYSVLTMVYLYVSDWIMLYFIPIIAYNIFQGFIIFIKGILGFNILILRTFLSVGSFMPSDLGFLQTTAQTSNLTGYTQ
ncbi:hypothetical protein NBO_9g0004 [Nosema bombycis CQ1]|uniref:Uncharacterized protein n=1 Tax=Nosema bombycis (strain CQ1 / CVCC 102059) TaxID=578461 RepID=R0KY31_NOSB1|nr:hypothetical protein NBO_9g0004 [Nosema bombycis CQ1]|eukprot:EOB15127.1 hypothetical protein NBO_9g0004 [Nosema bombycis CQ1]